MTNSYITPITNRTYSDVEYAKENQSDLENQNIGAWNYTDCNRVCNNILYAAEWMYEQGFFNEPYTLSIKTDWTETDIITYEELNSMIVNNINLLKSYSRDDLTWYPISSIANMDYNLANWIELDIDALATQEYPPADTYTLTVVNGTGSGDYEANTVVTITANDPEEGYIFDCWSGDNLQNIGNATASTTTYTMPYEAATLTANYTDYIPHTLTVITYTSTTTTELYEGDTIAIVADPAPTNQVFGEWTTSPSGYTNNLYEPAATTTFTMPDEDVTLTAVYVTNTVCQLVVNNGTGSGYYDYATYVSINSSKPSYATFSTWSGDTAYLTEAKTQEYNSVKIPDASKITLTASWSIPSVSVTIVNGTIYNSTATTGSYKMGSSFKVTVGDVTGQKFSYWSTTSGATISDTTATTTTITIGTTATSVTITAVFVTAEVTLTTVDATITDTGETSGTYLKDDVVSIIADDAEEGYEFGYWSKSGGGTLSSYSANPTTITLGSTDVTVTAYYDALDVELEIVNGTISATGETVGYYTQGSSVKIVADDIDGKVFTSWTKSGGGTISSTTDSTTTVTTGATKTTVTANYRTLAYYTLTVETYSGTTVSTVEQYEYFSVNANPAPDGYTFDYWSGDTGMYHGSKFDTTSASTGTYMGVSDRTITANYRELLSYTLTVHQLSGDVTYTMTEGDSIEITADDALTDTKWSKWTLSGYGSLSSTSSQTTTYTFGQGNGELTPNYLNLYDISIVNGAFGTSTSSTVTTKTDVTEGSTYSIICRSREIYEKFDGWTVSGAGSFTNSASTSTTFTVGAGDAVITANISNYPDKTVSVYFQDPDTEDVTLVSETTYTYGTTGIVVTAPEAPDKTTFLTWTGDTTALASTSSVLSSTVILGTLTTNVALTATYYYPESPEYYTLTVNNGSPESGSYAEGSYITVTANDPEQGWEFYKWMGDTSYLINQDLTQISNAVIMPAQAITLTAKYNVEGELPTFRVTVTGGIASGSYTDSEEEVHNESGVYIDIPAGTEVTLTADADIDDYVFSYWSGNFEEAGVTDIVTTNNPTVFTMVENDIDVVMYRRERTTCTVYTTNASGPGTAAGDGKTYTIAGTLVDTDDYHYTFKYWTCVDANGNDYSSAIADTTSVETEITLTNVDLWIEAVYDTYYKLTVVNGQDTGSGYYLEGETINTITANDPPNENMVFDYWTDPVGIIGNIYDPTPVITMSNSIATITAVYVSIDSQSNSIAVTGDDISTGTITRSNSYLINGLFVEGTIIFDGEGSIGVITNTDIDGDDDTEDYEVKQLFYGGTF